MSDDEGVLLARITITRVLVESDVIDSVTAETNDGDDLGLADALGMMRLAEHTLIESYGKEDE